MLQRIYVNYPPSLAHFSMWKLYIWSMDKKYTFRDYINHPPASNTHLMANKIKWIQDDGL